MPTVFLINLAAGIAVLLSAAGWGYVALRALRLPMTDLGMALVVGMALEILVGGVLNLAGAIGLASSLCLIIPGGLIELSLLCRGGGLQGWTHVWKATRGRTFLRTALCVSAALIALRFLAAAHALNLNPDDDLQAYLVFPTKMAQTGHLGIDPFSSRRNESALGGSYYLASLVLSFSDQTSAYFVEGAMGLISVCAVFAGLLRDWKARGWLCVRVLFLIAFVLPPRANVTSVLLSAAFAGAIFRLQASGPLLRRRPGAIILLMGLLTGTLCALKSSMIPPAGLFLVACLVVDVVRSPHGRRVVVPLVRFGGAAAISAVCLLPWMLAMYPSAGTFLFPVFGQGNRNLPPPSHGMPLLTAAKVVAFGSPFVGLSALLAINAVRGRLTLRVFAAAALLAAAGGGAIALGLSTSGVGFARQCYPFIFPGVLAFVVVALNGDLNQALPRLEKMARQCAHATVFIFLAGGLVWAIWSHGFVEIMMDLQGGLSGRPIVTQEKRNSITAMQSCVPEGKRLLTAIDRPFLLDFSRNNIWITDIAGAWSPPPHFGDASSVIELVEVLRANDVRYVAFDYRTFERSRADSIKSLDGMYAWTHAVIERSLEFHDALEQMKASYSPIFDDGNTVVLDLQEPTRVQP